MQDTLTNMTTREAAAYLRRSVDTLSRWRMAGTGPRFAGGGAGRIVLYRKVDLDAWVEAQLRSSTSEARQG